MRTKITTNPNILATNFSQTAIDSSERDKGFEPLKKRAFNMALSLVLFLVCCWVYFLLKLMISMRRIETSAVLVVPFGIMTVVTSLHQVLSGSEATRYARLNGMVLGFNQLISMIVILQTVTLHYKPGILILRFTALMLSISTLLSFIQMLITTAAIDHWRRLKEKDAREQSVLVFDSLELIGWTISFFIRLQLTVYFFVGQVNEKKLYLSTRVQVASIPYFLAAATLGPVGLWLVVRLLREQRTKAFNLPAGFVWLLISGVTLCEAAFPLVYYFEILGADQAGYYSEDRFRQIILLLVFGLKALLGVLLVCQVKRLGFSTRSRVRPKAKETIKQVNGLAQVPRAKRSLTTSLRLDDLQKQIKPRAESEKVMLERTQEATQGLVSSERQFNRGHHIPLNIESLKDPSSLDLSCKVETNNIESCKSSVPSELPHKGYDFSRYAEKTKMIQDYNLKQYGQEVLFEGDEPDEESEQQEEVNFVIQQNSEKFIPLTEDDLKYLMVSRPAEYQQMLEDNKEAPHKSTRVLKLQEVPEVERAARVESDRQLASAHKLVLPVDWDEEVDLSPKKLVFNRAELDKQFPPLSDIKRIEVLVKMTEIFEKKRLPSADTKRCTLCCEAEVDTIFMPCGHSGTCFRCFVTMIEHNSGLCYLCRSRIHKIYRIDPSSSYKAIHRIVECFKVEDE